MNQARSQAADRFLAAHGWAGAARSNLAGDASFRRYERVWHPVHGKAVLMDAPPDKEDVRPFVRVAQFLRVCGLSAPTILAQNETEGFLLLEDLGDDSFTRVLRAQPDAEGKLYMAALEVLLALHTRKEVLEELPSYDQALLMREALLFSEWFLPQVIPPTECEARQREFSALWGQLLLQHAPPCNQFVHRDFHADNLMWLPTRQGAANVGLLDFQDAVLGDAAYDLVSLLEDARRDVKAETVQALLKHYIACTGVDEADFMRRYALLGAQRNCKIVGIFVRLTVRDGKGHYLDYLPRVWAHLAHDLEHPVLSELKHWMDSHVPAPMRGRLTIGRL